MFDPSCIVRALGDFHKLYFSKQSCFEIPKLQNCTFWITYAVVFQFLLPKDISRPKNFHFRRVRFFSDFFSSQDGFTLFYLLDSDLCYFPRIWSLHRGSVISHFDIMGFVLNWGYFHFEMGQNFGDCIGVNKYHSHPLLSGSVQEQGKFTFWKKSKFW